MKRKKEKKKKIYFEITNNIIDKHGRGECYKTISKEFDVLVKMVANIIKKFKVQAL